MRLLYLIHFVSWSDRIDYGVVVVQLLTNEGELECTNEKSLSGDMVPGPGACSRLPTSIYRLLLQLYSVNCHTRRFKKHVLDRF